MNSTSPQPEADHGMFPTIFGYIIGALSLISIILLTVYICNRRISPPPHPFHDTVSASSDDQDPSSSDTINIEAALSTYPKIVLSKAKLEKGDYRIASSCSICLAEYGDKDMVRLLPDCDHFFHVQCIDKWLKLNPTCPICRNASTHGASNQTPQLPRTPSTQPFGTNSAIRVDNPSFYC